MFKFYFLITFIILIGVNCLGQDSALNYSRVFVLDSVSKNDIYDRALLWCSKSFIDSKGAINVKDKESGIIAGKGLIKNYYKIPRKKDSINYYLFNDYYFDWLIEIKDNKARISLKNIEVRESDIDYPVTKSINPPIKIMFQSPEKQQLIWDLSKKGFLRNVDYITNTLYADLNKKADNW